MNSHYEGGVGEYQGTPAALGDGYFAKVIRQVERATI